MGGEGGRGMNNPNDNPFYSNIDSMPDIRPRRKSIPLVSELVSRAFTSLNFNLTVCDPTTLILSPYSLLFVDLTFESQMSERKMFASPDDISTNQYSHPK